jgi:hypothetical protein
MLAHREQKRGGGSLGPVAYAHRQRSVALRAEDRCWRIGKGWLRTNKGLGQNLLKQLKNRFYGAIRSQRYGCLVLAAFANCFSLRP